MAGISAFAGKYLLDFLSGTASTPAKPASWSVNVSLGVPSATSASEIATGSGISRQTVTFAAAASGAAFGGSNSNINAMTWGPSSGAATVSGIDVFDTTATGGNMLYYGTLTTARTLGAGDSLVVSAGSLVVTLG
jgi:hypothetical protein